MKTIPLTQGKVAMVDDDDFEELSRHRWHVLRSAKTFYARRQTRKDGHRVTIHMHREIIHAPPELQCDHVNHNGLDNRRANLRLCTNVENAQNKRLQGGLSPYKGLNERAHGKRWAAQIITNGVHHHLGVFEDEIDAARAYDKAASKMFGEFALLNFPNKMMCRPPSQKMRRLTRLQKLCQMTELDKLLDKRERARRKRRA